MGFVQIFIRKATKKSLTNKLDKICSELIRSRGQCQRCFLSDYAKLQCCHIYSRRKRAVRWDLDNMLCLCVSCHFWGHQHPLEFTDLVKLCLGDIRYHALKQRANSIKKWSLEEMKEYYEALKEEKENQWTK